MFRFSCEACKAKDDMISFLKEELKRRDEAWAVERAEYKRAIDALLAKKGMPRVGQGVEREQNMKFDFANLNIFEDVIEQREKKNLEVNR